MIVAKCLWFITVICSLGHLEASNIGATRQDINHDTTDGGYTNILIAIDDKVGEDLGLLEAIKDMVSKGSEALVVATKNQKYIKNVTVLVPDTWTHQSDWGTVKSQSFERARILVAPSNGFWGDRPYTKQPGQCGVEGDYIHYTPNYLLNSSVAESYGPRDKTFVHEWSHLRWGLFDEYAVDDEDQKFLTRRRKLYPTQCVQGRNGVIRDGTTVSGGCVFDRRTGLPTSTCEFVPDDESQFKASIMFAEYLSSVNSFCESVELDLAESTHDTLSGNRQNRLCESRSAWEVLNNHTDFVSNTIPEERITTEPSFEIIQDYTPVVSTTTSTSTTTVATTTKSETTQSITTTTEKPEAVENGNMVCLVLDVSGSMDTDDRIGKMGSAVANYLRNYLEEGTAVGIVKFSSSASTLAPLTVIKDESTRDMLISRIPILAGGGTSIGAGLDTCLQELRKYDEERIGSARLFVLSDGKENVSPYADEILPDIKRFGVTVDSIAYSQDADPVLGDLASETGGFGFYFSGIPTSTALQDALLATIEKRRTTESPITVFIVPRGGELKKTVFIDNSIGKDTVLMFTYDSLITVTVDTPNNNAITEIKDTSFSLLTERITGTTNGLINFTITNTSPLSDANVLVFVTSKASQSGEDPITVSARMDQSNVQFQAQSKINIYADVYKGLNPVVGVNVKGILELENGNELIIDLLDGGAGPDTIPKDGVYSGTILSDQLTGDGFYSLKVAVEGFGELAAGSFSGASGDCTNCQTDPGSSLGAISRSSAGGMFRVENFDATIAAQDNFAPGQIRDLQLTAIVYGGSDINLTWTASGDDLYAGNVTSHQLSVWYEELGKRDAVLYLPSELSIPKVEEISATSGEKIEITVSVGSLDRDFFGITNDSIEVDTLYFRVRGVDDSGNYGVWSNEISASFVNPEDYETEVTVNEEESYNGLSQASIVALAVCLSLAIILIISIPIIVGCYVHNKKKNKVQAFH